MATTAGTSLSRKIGSACEPTSGSECSEAKCQRIMGVRWSCRTAGLHHVARESSPAAVLTSTAAALHSSNVTSSKCGFRRIGMIAMASLACCGVPDLFKTCSRHMHAWLRHEDVELPNNKQTRGLRQAPPSPPCPM